MRDGGIGLFYVVQWDVQVNPVCNTLDLGGWGCISFNCDRVVEELSPVVL